MEEKKSFLKEGLDLDSEERLVQGYRYALNVNIGTSDDNNRGAVENSLGNRLISFTLPSGSLKVIGTYSDTVNNSIIYFLFNSSQLHVILRFFIEDESIVEIARGSALNFQEDELITGIGLDGDLLAWATKLNPQRKINVSKGAIENNISVNIYSEYFPIISTDYTLEIAQLSFSTIVWTVPGPNPATLAEFTAKVTEGINGLPQAAGNFEAEDAGTHVILRMLTPGYFDITFSADTANALAVYSNTYQHPIIESYIDLLKSPPVFPPVANFVADTSFKETNDVERKIFEFRTRYLFDDGEKSALSPISKLPISGEYPFVEDNDSYILVNYLNDRLSSIPELSIITGIDMFMREENVGTWKKAKTILLDEIIGTNGKFIFLNNEEYPAVSLKDADKNFDTLPVLSSTLAFMNNYLFLDGLLEGYDAVFTNVEITLDVKDEVIFGDPSDRGSFIKRPGSYKWGIIYYDRGNRSSTISKDPTMELRIPGYSEDLTEFIYVEGLQPSPDVRNGIIEVNWKIKHIPPLFATHFSWSRTLDSVHNTYLDASVQQVPVYYKQDRITVVAYNNADVAYVKLKFSGWVAFNEKYPQGTQGWAFVLGDKMRILKDETPTSGTFLIDIPTLDIADQIDDTTFFVEVNDTIPLIKKEYLVEFYVPGKEVESDVYFELGEFFEISNPHTAGRAHRGPIQSQNPGDPIGTPAKGTFVEGDNYRITMRDGGALQQIVDSPRADQRFEARMESYNVGRVNVYAPGIGQADRGNIVRYSGKRFEGSNINGYSTFDFDSIYDKIDKSNGNIQHLKRVDNILLSIHTREAIALYIEERLLTSVGGDSNVTTSNEVIGDDRVLKGGFGTENPESFVLHKSRGYWFSANKGEYVRYGGDGITVLSDVFMAKYFKEKGTLLRKYKGNVISTFDQFHDKVIVAFSDIKDGETLISSAETLSFDDGAIKRWTSFWSYIPEHMSMLDTKIVTFRDGQLWIHDNETRNNYYGTQYTSRIQPVFNGGKGVVKVFESISNEGNAAWVAIQLSTLEGQLSSLNEDDYTKLEDIFYSQILRDENTPNVPNPVTQGDVMRSVALKTLLENSETSKATLVFVTVGYSVSQSHAT